MSFASMHNDYLDPDRHLWPDEDDEETPMDVQSIRDMVAEYDNPYWFYRSVYKGTDCGPSVGMQFTGSSKWVYGSDLPNDAAMCQQVTGIGVSSIVEGSDVETEFRTAKNAEAFWEAVEEVNEEASFYWKRDNTTNLILRHGNVETYAAWTEFEDKPEWDEKFVSEEVVKAAFDAHWDNQTEVTVGGKTWTIEEYIDESTF